MMFVFGLVLLTCCPVSSIQEFHKRGYEDSGNASFEDFGFEDLAGFEDAGFKGSRFKGSRFEDALFEDAGFEDAGFEDAGFEDAGFEDAGFEDAKMDEELAAALFPEGADSTEYCETVREVERPMVIRSPVTAEKKYPNSLDCVWRMRAPHENQTVSIHFKLFKVQNSRTCQPDFVTIHDGALKTDSLIAKLCGFRRTHSSFPGGTHTSTGQFLTLRFRSNANIHLRGWVAIVEFLEPGTCPNSLVSLLANTDTKYLSFPLLGFYQSVGCGWLIQAPEGQYVEFNHTGMDIAKVGRCETAYLVFVDGRKWWQDVSIGNRVCGTLDDIPELELVKRSTGRYMIIIFIGYDGTGIHEGFQGQYKAVSTPGVPLCPSSAVELSGNGTIVFPPRGDHYVNQMRCEWHFNASEGQKIRLTFRHFKIEYHSRCSFDILEFYDSDSPSASPIHYMCGMRYSGYEFTSPTNYLLMRFRSNYEYTYSGFEVDYETVNEDETMNKDEDMPVFGCSAESQVIPPEGGIIQVPLTGSSYDNNLNCLWTLYAPDDHVVRVKFLSVDIAPSDNCTEDRVDLAEGDQFDSNLIGQVCGSSLPTPFISKTNVMKIRFVTNAEGVASGFKLTILPGMNGTCGSPLITRRSKRIVGGENAEPHSWPWMVSIRFPIQPNIVWCSGAIISRNWIVTSRCVSPSYNNDVIVVASDHLKQWSYSGETTRQVRVVAEIIRYPGYYGKGTAPDIALFRLSYPLDLDPQSAHPVCLPPGNVPVPDYTSCFTTGWGETNNNEKENFLQEVELTIVPQDICNGSNYHNNEIHDYELCAENNVVPKNLCPRDHGNPLVCLINGKYELHGIASWNFDCDLLKPSEKPVVFTRITEVVDWINSNAVD